MEHLIYILIPFSLYLLIGQSFSIIYYPTKFFHLAHAAIITFGAYLTFLFANMLSMPFSISVIIAILMSTSVGIMFEVLVYRRMRHRNMQLLAYLIASLGLYFVLQNCISLFFGDDTKILDNSEITIGNQILGAYITNIQIIIILSSIALFIAVNLFLHHTAIGKSIRAVASNQELCNIYGISSNKTILIAFAIGSALAAIAGILSAMDTNMSPAFGFNLLLYGVVAMILGGVGSTKGLVAGSLLVATAQHFSSFYLDTKWMDSITYIILILFLIWKPLGFSGKLLKKVEV
jgi:branched-chain amino acid transport system permease protein